MSKPKHHIRQEVCIARPPYRDGRKPTAVKVYTVHHESKYLLVQGVSAVGAANELVKLFESVGDIEEHKVLDDYPSEQFTEVHLIKYKRIQSARFAKRRYDDWSFYGGVLHVCYAPEFETVQETREKLRDRRRVVEAKTRQYKSDGTYSSGFSQTSQSSSSDPHIDIDETNKPHVPLSGVTGQKHDAVVTSDTQFTQYTGSDQVYDQTSTDPNRQYLPPSNSHTNDTYHSYGGKAVPSQQNLHNYQPHIVPSNNHDTYHSYGGQAVPSQQNLHNYQPHIVQNIQNNSESFISRSGSVEQHTKKVSDTQAPLTYAEQVVQQARSLQNYGKGFFLNRENTQKRPNVNEDTSTVNENVQKAQHGPAENEEEIFLPPPPKQRRGSDTSFRKSKKYTGAKVPSAQATFPADFDARTDKYSAETEDEISKGPANLESGFNEKIDKIKCREDMNKPGATTTMQQKVEENLKKTNVVIKDFNKKGTIPKFIPRQAQVRKKAEKSPDGKKTSEVCNKTNELNRELRKNAFKLGKAQGPADLGPSSSNENLDGKEKSVIESMLEIRRKIAKV